MVFSIKLYLGDNGQTIEAIVRKIDRHWSRQLLLPPCWQVLWRGGQKINSRSRDFEKKSQKSISIRQIEYARQKRRMLALLLSLQLQRNYFKGAVFFLHGEKDNWNCR